MPYSREIHTSILRSNHSWPVKIWRRFAQLRGGKPLKTAVSFLLVFALGLATSPAQNAGNQVSSAALAQADKREVKDAYHVVQVGQFEIQQGVDFPAEYLAALHQEIAKQLAQAKVFQQVLQAGQNPADSKEPVLRLSGTITNYNPGNRAKRYFIGHGAGSAEIEARVFFLDGATGRLLMTEELRAVLSYGFFGGKAEGATKDFARQIVTKTKLMLVTRMPSAEEAAASVAADTAGIASPSTREWHVLTISAKDWPGSQQKLDQEAAAGYRVVGLLLTGERTADVELEKPAAPAGVYQYRLLHTRLASNLQKDINKAADEGFRVSAHTLADFMEWAGLIMEKPPVTSKTRYLYMVKQSMRISSAQKDTEKYQSEGYTLVEETERSGSLHLLLFEKAIEDEK